MMIRTKTSTNQNGKFRHGRSSRSSPCFSRSDDISDWDQAFISRFTVADGTLFDVIMVNPLADRTLHVALFSSCVGGELFGY